MKFKGEVLIKKPQAQVAAMFVDPQYMGEYQDGFKRKEIIEGEVAQEGTISKIYYQYGKNEMELTETITKSNLPNSIEAFYHHKHMDNTMKCTFTAVDENTTNYKYEFEYTQVRGFMPKLMMKLSPGMFKKPAAKWMRQFKAFVENKPD